MGRRTLLGIAAVGLIAISSIAWSGQPPLAGGKVVVVKMVDVSATAFKFEPAAVTVQSGDTLRFEQTTHTPHNVAFSASPAASNLGDAKTGPYLLAPGETYDLVIDARFPAGTYTLNCVPHEALGMTGVVTVKAGNAGQKKP